jgi:hypothetical protein
LPPQIELNILLSFQYQTRIYNKTYYALEFHHETDDKKYTVSKMKTLSIKTVMKEIEKCIVICANCHREIHHKKHEI